MHTHTHTHTHTHVHACMYVHTHAYNIPTPVHTQKLACTCILHVFTTPTTNTSNTRHKSVLHTCTTFKSVECSKVLYSWSQDHFYPKFRTNTKNLLVLQKLQKNKQLQKPEHLETIEFIQLNSVVPSFSCHKMDEHFIGNWYQSTSWNGPTVLGQHKDMLQIATYSSQ